MKHRLTRTLILCCFAFATTACKTPAEREQETTCEVIKLEPEGSGALTEPVCMVECLYHKGATFGIGTSTPVPCEGWLNKKVNRKAL